MGFDHQFGMLRLLVGIVHAGKARDLAFVNQLVQPFDITLAADFDGAVDIHFHEVTNFLASPGPRLAIGGDGSGDADHTVTGEQATHKGNAFNVGVAILAAEPQSFTEMSAHDIAVQYLNFALTSFE